MGVELEKPRFEQMCGEEQEALGPQIKQAPGKGGLSLVTRTIGLSNFFAS
jgi:hypothetical protein